MEVVSSQNSREGIEEARADVIRRLLNKALLRSRKHFWILSVPMFSLQNDNIA
jgi:hypothetical protein